MSLSFFSKLAACYVTLGAIIWIFQRLPNSRASRFAFSYFGPIPIVGELESQLMIRWSLYALLWVARIIFASACLYLIGLADSSLTKTTAFVTAMFFLALLGAMALLRAILGGCAACKAKFIGPNRNCIFKMGCPICSEEFVCEDQRKLQLLINAAASEYESCKSDSDFADLYSISRDLDMSKHLSMEQAMERLRLNSMLERAREERFPDGE